MTPPRADAIAPDPLLSALADFRFELRRFLQFSEAAALEVGLQPQQHQVLLQLAAVPAGTPAGIAFVAERLGLRHNTAVELVDRSEQQRLLERTTDPDDRRRVLLRLTARGRRLLLQLAEAHAQELGVLAPRLAVSLGHITANMAKAPGSGRTRS